MAGYDAATGERPSQTSVNPTPKSVRMWDVFRPHILDWVVFVLITAGSIAVDAIHPFQQFVNADYMQKYMYPLKPDSVPFWAVPVYVFGFPLLALTVSFILRRDFIDFHSSLLGFVFNCATTFLLTNALKVSIGRPRPHFFIVCFPSGVPVYGSDGNAQCNGSSSSVMESRVSFPSGHTSSMVVASICYFLHYPALSNQNCDIPLLSLGPDAESCQVIALGPAAIAFLVHYAIRRDIVDIHHSVLGLLFAFFSTILITDALKVSVGRPRPDFFIRCFPSGVPVYSSSGNALCNGNPSIVSEGRKSFPSGHASVSFSGLAYLSLFLAAKLHSISSSSAHLWRLLPPALPLVGGIAVGITRIDDYWHFPFDVFVGSLIGAWLIMP
ncbi:unnamed protein product [Closterium sp. Naga37s-1]|nr:unnamed protein product [Closterium sp. Naga37s-1]